MIENMTEEEKNEARLFIRNYKAVISTIKELKKGADKNDLARLETYEKQLEELILSITKYSKTFYSRTSYANGEDSQTKARIISKCTNNDKDRINDHNNLILKTNTADLICKALSCNLLFGNFGKYSDNIEALIQKDSEKVENMPIEARDKRLEVFRWAHNIVLFSLMGDKSRNHTEFIDDPLETLSTADFFKMLSESAMFENLMGKLNR